MTTGEAIRKARKSRKISMAKLGKMIDVTSTTICRYELNQRKVNTKMLKRIAEALEVDPYSLVSFDDTPMLINDAMAARNQLTAKERTLLDAFDQLNEAGQDKAVERVQELTDVPKYRADIYNGEEV